MKAIIEIDETGLCSLDLKKEKKQALLSLVDYQFYMENITVLFKILIVSFSVKSVMALFIKIRRPDYCLDRPRYKLRHRAHPSRKLPEGTALNKKNFLIVIKRFFDMRLTGILFYS